MTGLSTLLNAHISVRIQDGRRLSMPDVEGDNKCRKSGLSVMKQLGSVVDTTLQ